MLANESRRPEQSSLFAIREQGDDIVRQGFAPPQRANRFEQYRAPGRVVAGSRTGWHSVVVRHENDGEAARLRTGNSHQNVADASNRGVSRADPGRALFGGVEAE
jgi:hypothetical protein